MEVQKKVRCFWGCALVRADTFYHFLLKKWLVADTFYQRADTFYQRSDTFYQLPDTFYRTRHGSVCIGFFYKSIWPRKCWYILPKCWYILPECWYILPKCWYILPKTNWNSPECWYILPNTTKNKTKSAKKKVRCAKKRWNPLKKGWKMQKNARGRCSWTKFLPADTMYQKMWSLVSARIHAPTRCQSHCQAVCALWWVHGFRSVLRR